MLDTSNAVLVQPDGWPRGEREGYGEPCDVTSLSLSSFGQVLALTDLQALVRRRPDGYMLLCVCVVPTAVKR